MKTENLMSEEELGEIVVQHAWERAKEEILKQTQYAVMSDLSQRGISRGRILVAREIDKVLEPKLKSMAPVIEAGVQKILERLQTSVEQRVRESLRYTLRDLCDVFIQGLVDRTAGDFRRAVEKVIVEDEKCSKTSPQ